MLPYNPIVSISRAQQERLKPIPSMELMNMLANLCAKSGNFYDGKNHILTISDLPSFEIALEQNYDRTYRSFEKQLKILGFKARRMVRVDNAQNMAQVRIFKWRGKKEQLVNQELEYIESNLKERRRLMEKGKVMLDKNKKFIDEEIERIILTLMVDQKTINAGECIGEAIENTRTMVNSTEVELRKIVQQISNTMGNELELYRLLIYKESDQYKNEENMHPDTDERQQQNQSQKSASISINVEEGDKFE